MRLPRWLAQLMLLLAAFGSMQGRALAKDEGEGVVNKLLAPGPLIEGHKNLEHGDCLKCHDAGKGVPSDKCLSCHTDIKKSIAEKDSYHGLMQSTCIACHSDHKGRAYNSTAVNTKTFKHALTGFKLNGAHSKLDCAKCHTEKRTEKPIRKNEIRFFGLDDTCIGCHKKDDPHHFTGKLAGKECSACHNEISWKNGTFDHKKETGYALIGEHAKIECSDCHVKKGGVVQYDFPTLATSKCLTCHADQHKDNLSPKFRGGTCEQCHTQTSWKIGNFKHDITGFPLRGAHAKQTCVSCHATPAAKGKVGAFDFAKAEPACASCHADYHGFRAETSPKLGTLNQCATCHNETAWKAALKFDHNTQTGYPITGLHKGVKCFSCHKPETGGAKPNVDRIYDFPNLTNKTCETCHKNPHLNNPSPAFKNNKCSTCHTTEGWKKMAPSGAGGVGGFNHDTMTKFPLTGDHKALSCSTCHVKGGKEVFTFDNGGKQFCVSCHASPHKDQFQPKFNDASCATCHNTTDFKTQIFDHAKARFPLTGAHAQISAKCSSCHTPTKKTLAVKPPRPAGKFKFPNADKGFCLECHKDPHAKQFTGKLPSSDCRTCHDVNKFADLLRFDHGKTDFKIVGAHTKIAQKCEECHVKTKAILPVKPPKQAGKFIFSDAEGGYCKSCHANVHDKQFSKEFTAQPCRTCHTQVAFDPRLPFDHGKTDFKLTGAHAKIEKKCVECHTKTDKVLTEKPRVMASKFQFGYGKAGYCQSCHMNEHTKQFHARFSSKPCADCHTTTSFAKGNKFDHKWSQYHLKGAHLKVKCEACHVDTKVKFKTPPHNFKGKYLFKDLYTKDCATCHADPHEGRFGKRCSDCHTETGWDETASFHKDFVLTGVHYLLECSECHADKKALSGTGNDCKTCHAKDDIHMGTQPDCQSCHTQQFWSAAKFQHSMTSFPLRGAHRTMECSTCHAAGVYEGLPAECASCHFQDALKVTTPNHQSGGFENCETCHNQFSFGAAP